MRTLKYLLPLLIAPFCFGQQVQTTVIPPCTLNFTFNATSLTSANFPNSTSGCDKWTLLVYNAGFGSFTVTLQSAVAATPSTPGTFGTYTGTTATGSNPMTATGIATFTNGTVATPWLRLVFTGTGAGTVYGVLQGSQTVISKGGGGGGGGGPTIAGTANQITATGAGCTTPSTATCTIAIATNPVLPGNPSTPGTFTSGVGSGATGALDLVGKTSGATSTVTVDDSNTATIVKLPNDATSGLYAATSPTATPVAGCAQYNGTGTQAASTGTPCGAGGSGSAGATLFSTTGSTTVTATSPTTLIGAGTGSTTVPANTFTAGQVLEVAAQGFYSTPGTPSSLTISLNIGGTIRITTGVVLQQASVNTNVWRIRCIVTTRTAGSSGTQIANCIFEETGSAPYPQNVSMQIASAWTIDTTATQVIDLVATWSTAVGAPTITSTNVAAWIPGAPVTSVGGLTGAIPGQGNGAKVQMSTGSTTTNDCVKFDANGNTVDAGAACGSGGGGGSASRGVFGSRPAAGTAGNTYYSTDIPVISQDNGSSWANWYNGQFVTLPSTLSFTARNSASFTTNGVSIVNPAATGSTLFGEDIPIPSTPYTLWVGLNCNQSNANAYCGMYVLNATGGTCVTYALLSGVAIQTAHFTSCLSGTLTGGTQDSTAPQSSIFQGKLNYFRLVDDGTNFKFYYCTDKIAAACLLSFTESRTANLSNPGFLGWFGSTNSGVPLSAITAFDFTVTQP